MNVIDSINKGEMSYCKYLSANDSGETGGHQSGILISKTAKDIMFSENLSKTDIMSRYVCIKWNNQEESIETSSRFTYYPSKGELRITRLGRNFPWLKPEQTGSLFILTKINQEYYEAWFLDHDEDIEAFLDHMNMSPVETNRIFSTKKSLDAAEEKEIETFIEQLTIDFPTSSLMSEKAEEIENKLYNNQALIVSQPGKKLLRWTEMEFKLFRALEVSRYGQKIQNGFTNIDDFIDLANEVLNRRKSRAGKSLEHHLSTILKFNQIKFDEQKVTENNKKPDFIFPSIESYHSETFPVEKLVTLAAKTTCKDRWRQIINEADKLKGRTKFLSCGHS